MKNRRDIPVSYYRNGNVMQSRSVSDVVLFGTVDVPAPSSRLVADWEREISLHLRLQPGDVEALPLARARMRWPEYKRCVQAAAEWTRALGLNDLLACASTDVALMACRGARYHHDGAQYGGAVFCNLFLSEDRGLDLHFAQAHHRIPLVRGTVVIFDTGQPHGVIDRSRGSRGGFKLDDFPADRDCTQVFLTWELPIDNVNVVNIAEALGIAFDIDPSASSLLEEEQVWRHGAPVSVCPESGRWLQSLPASDP